MPFYVYACSVCNVERTVLSKVGEEAPRCDNAEAHGLVPAQAPVMVKQVSAPSFVLHGVGVYKNGTH